MLLVKGYEAVAMQSEASHDSHSDLELDHP